MKILIGEIEKSTITLQTFHSSLSVIGKMSRQGTSLVAQWLKIRLPVQGTRVQALVREDPTCHRATKPVRHDY